MIKVYVHNTEDWIGVSCKYFPTLVEFIEDEYTLNDPKWNWTEIGEL